MRTVRRQTAWSETGNRAGFPLGLALVFVAVPALVLAVLWSLIFRPSEVLYPTRGA
jgi:hypothetical protein